MLNSCDFQGRLAADPELRTTQTGKQVASFRMAVDRDMVDANGHRPTDWLTFTAWGKTAEFVSKYFRKGSAAVVHSRCQTRQYEDKNGNNRTAIEFVVDNIYFAGPKQDNQQGTVDDGGTNPPPATYRSSGLMMAARHRLRATSRPIRTSSRSRWASPPRVSASSGRGRPIIPAMFRSARAFLRAVTMISRFWTMPMICRSKEVH